MTADRPRILFYVQHLLGIGHLKRTATLARAMEAAGLAVTIVSGGKQVPGLDIGKADFVQLPAMRSADEHFAVMLDDDDQPVTDQQRSERRDTLLRTLEAVSPDVILTELFPFGRRQLRRELLPMIEQARALPTPPVIISSVRDILVEPSKASRGPEMVNMVERYFDLVLIHGDPEMVPFERTFPLADRIADKLRYTGYVVDPPPPQDPNHRPGAGEVIVSAGGGALSEPLLRAALSARANTALCDATWRLLAGPALPQESFDQLQKDAGPGFILERSRADFTTLLGNCALSISQGGYNTVMDVLAARVRSVIAPYAGGKETEQTLRARLLAERSPLQVVWEDELSAETLARAVDAAIAGPTPDAAAIDTDGAKVTAEIVAGLATRHQRATS
jgi:predicted glycosyltransferase